CRLDPGGLADLPGGPLGLGQDRVHRRPGIGADRLEDVFERHQPPRRMMSMAATAKPRITRVSGMATSRITRPVSSGFSAMAPMPADPIRAWAKPVAMAPRPTASPAPMAMSPISMIYLLMVGR